MRTALIALLLMGLTTATGAQSRGGSDEIPLPSIGLPLPHIGLPLPPIGLALPPMGLPPQQTPPAILATPDAGREPRFRGGSNRHGGGAVILFMPAFAWPYLPGTPAPSLPSPPPQEKRATGRLRLELQSGIDPQIFVDDYFVGALSDLGGEVTVNVGRHRLELRAEGYEPLRIDIQMSRDGATYRGQMKPITAPPASVSAVPASPDVPPPAPSTIYVIPGCYMGNVPPKDAALPAGCDERDAVAFPSRP